MSMKKKGFTLVELLAVIAILAILVIIALPNIMSLFNQSKQNSFENELKTIFKTAEQEWMKDSMFDTQNIVYARNKSEKCTKELSLSGREEIEYYIEVDKGGNIIKYFATDGSYQYEYNGTGLKIEEIGGSKQAANLQNTDIITVTCTGVTKSGGDTGSSDAPGELLVGANKGQDCSNNEVANTIPSNAKGLYKIMAEQSYLDNAKSEFVTRCQGVDFANISSNTNGKGVYEIASTKDDAYPIYYYRGAVTNNNVKFAGFCWKAVRTTNTGGVKLVYNGTPDASGHCTNTTGESTQIKKINFNRSISPTFVGYMYGTKDGTSTGTPYTATQRSVSSSDTYKFGTSVTYSGGTYTLMNTMNVTSSNYNRPYYFNNHHYTCFSSSSTCTTLYYVFYIDVDASKYYYIPISGVDPNGRELIEVIKEIMFRNDRDSTAKTEIDNWYRDNMTSYTSKIEDTVYCNDRSISDEAGWKSTGDMSNVRLSFGGYSRTLSTHKPSLACERMNDRFTVSESLGNGKLKYPVGLLTTDEIMLAGGKDDINNWSYYLYTDQSYWTLTPSDFANQSIASGFITGWRYFEGRIIFTGTDAFSGLRPVISLSKNTSVTEGDGTKDNPYIVE